MKLILICFFACVGFSRAAGASFDTVDYWHLYYNQKDIAQFSPTTNKHLVSIKKTTVHPSDTLVVRYGTDRPSPDAITSLYVVDNKNNKVLLAHSKGNWNPLAVSMSEILRLMTLYKTLKLNFYYRDNRHDTQIFTLLLK